jgi:hypothetical protein
VEKLAKLLLPAKGQIINKDRFYKEFGEEKDDEGKAETKKSYKPEDFEAVFTGNTDDSFRIGISVAKRTLKVNHNQISPWNYIYLIKCCFCVTCSFTLGSTKPIYLSHLLWERARYLPKTLTFSVASKCS